MHSKLETIPGYVIVEILKQDHDRKCFKEIKLANGEVKFLTLNLTSSKLYDDHYSQGVSLAKVISVGDGCEYLQEGDTVIVDYTIDTDTASIISTDGGVKLVRANGLNVFYKTNKLISASIYSRFETYEYKIGDLESASTIFGILRGDEIIPNYPYVFLKYVNIEGEFEETESGLLIPSTEGELIIRQVLFAHPDSPMQPGDTVIVDYGTLYEREVGGELISICMQDDLIAKIL